MDTLNKILNRFFPDVARHEGVLDKISMPMNIPNFGREDLARLFYHLGFKVGAEIGVESGEYSEKLLHSNHLLTLYCIDAWQVHRAYRDHTKQDKLDRFYKETRDRLYCCEEQGRAKIMRKYSMDALKDFNDRSLDFVYIDANHKFVEVANDIHYWAKKVKQGGIVAGHDFTKYKNPAVEIHPAFVVPAFCDAYNIRPYFTIGEGVDSVKSWFFVQTLK